MCICPFKILGLPRFGVKHMEAWVLSASERPFLRAMGSQERKKTLIFFGGGGAGVGAPCFSLKKQAKEHQGISFGKEKFLTGAGWGVCVCARACGVIFFSSLLPGTRMKQRPPSTQAFSNTSGELPTLAYDFCLELSRGYSKTQPRAD